MAQTAFCLFLVLKLPSWNATGSPSILVIYSTQYETLRNSPFSCCSMPFISTNFLPDIKHHLHHQRNRNKKTVIEMIITSKESWFATLYFFYAIEQIEFSLRVKINGAGGKVVNTSLIRLIRALCWLFQQMIQMAIVNRMQGKIILLSFYQYWNGDFNKSS